MQQLALVLAGVVAGGLLLARIPTLPPSRGRRWTGAPSVSIVVPARDEESTLPVLLASLAALEPAPQEVIVVDDGSTDGTACIARDHGATVIPVTPPSGWVGKPWACHVGARAATGDVLVFLDADTRLAPDGLGRLLAAHVARGGLVSVEPYHHTERPYEQLSAFFSVTSMMGTGAFAPGRDGRAPMAFGPCLVTSATDYHVVGGHAEVAADVVEDVHLARRYRDHGLPVHSLAGGDAVSFRMYPAGLAQLVEGWTKNIAAGAGLSPRWAMAGSIAWVASSVATALTGVRGMAAWAFAGAAAPYVPLAVWTALAVQLAWMLARTGRWRWWAAVVFPIPLVAFLVVFARSLAITLVGGEVTWRDRRLPVGARSGR